MAEKKVTKLTQEGYENAQATFKELIQKRKEIADRLEEARKQGDLSENSEYDEAKEAQTNNEREIKKYEEILKNYEIVKEDSNTDTVHIGHVVVLRDEEEGEEEEYQSVGSTEADPMNGKISNESPVGQAILGKKKGATVTVETPAGSFKYTIVNIKKAGKK